MTSYRYTVGVKQVKSPENVIEVVAANPKDAIAVATHLLGLAPLSQTPMEDSIAWDDVAPRAQRHGSQGAGRVQVAPQDDRQH